MRSKASASGTPTRCCSTSSVNSLADRLRRLAGDDGQALDQRQARLDAAHDDVDGVGELVDELGLPALGEAGQDPARQAPGADEGPEQRHDDRQVGRRQPDARPTSDAAADAGDPERARRDVEAGPLQAQAQRDLLARLLPVLELLQRLGDLALAVLGDVRLRLDGDAPRLVLGHALDALVGAPLAGEVRVDQQIDDGADRDGRQQQQPDEHEVVAIHERHPWDCRGYRAPRPRRAPAPGARSRRSTRRAPRSADGRCRSSGGGR